MESVLAFIITLLVFSYILGDNLLYRLAIYVFVGLTAAYTTIVTIESVFVPLADGTFLNTFLLLGGATLAFLLFLKPARTLTPLSNIALAFLIGVGTAVALLGAVTGTLIPLANLTTLQGSPLEIIIVFIGIATSLIYFQSLARQRPDGVVLRPRGLGGLAAIGQGFIVVTLGAIYGSAILTSLSVLTGHFSRLFGG